MVYCPSCGSPNEDAAQSCTECGHSLAVRPETMGPPQAPPGGRVGVGRTLLIALLALVMVGAVAGAVYYLIQGAGGDWIAYQTRDSDGDYSLWIVRPDGEERIEVMSRIEGGIQYTSVLEGEQQYKYTPFAPKGQRMVFSTVGGGEHSLYTYALGNDEADRIVRRAQYLWYRYSPDGDRIAVQVYADYEGSLLVMDSDGENEVSLFEGVEGEVWSAWMPNGRELVVGMYDQGEYSLLLTDDQGEEQPTIVDEMEGMQYNVSLKGARLAYAIEEDDEWDVYVARADGSDPTRLERGLDDVRLLGFSSDSKQLLMRASSDGYSYDLYLMKTDGTEEVTLARDVDGAVGGFCPGGKRIWFEIEEDGDRSLYLVDADGENEVRVERRIDDYEMAFTPNGRTMIVGLESGSDWDLYAAEVATGEMVELLGSVDDLGPLVIMDNKQVLFSAADGGDWSLYVARIDGKDTVEVVGPVDGFDGYDASPDGRRIVYSEERSGGTRLYVIDADGENEERLADDGFAPIWSD